MLNYLTSKTNNIPIHLILVLFWLNILYHKLVTIRKMDCLLDAQEFKKKNFNQFWFHVVGCCHRSMVDQSYTHPKCKDCNSLLNMNSFLSTPYILLFYFHYPFIWLSIFIFTFISTLFYNFLLFVCFYI